MTLSLSGDTLVASGRAPGLWIVRAETVAPALAGVGAVNLSSVAAGLPAEVESLARAIERRHALFAAGSDLLDEAALATTRHELAESAHSVTKLTAEHDDLVRNYDRLAKEQDELATKAL